MRVRIQKISWVMLLAPVIWFVSIPAYISFSEHPFCKVQSNVSCATIVIVAGVIVIFGAFVSIGILALVRILEHRHRVELLEVNAQEKYFSYKDEKKDEVRTIHFSKMKFVDVNRLSVRKGPLTTLWIVFDNPEDLNRVLDAFES